MISGFTLAVYKDDGGYRFHGEVTNDSDDFILDMLRGMQKGLHEEGFGCEVEIERREFLQ